MALKGIFNQSEPLAKLFQFLVVLLVSAVLFSIVGIWIVQGNMNDVNSLKIIQLFQHFGLFIIPSFLLAYLWSHKPLNYLRISKKPHAQYAFFAVLIMITAVPAINFIGEINSKIRLPEFLASFKEWMKAMEEAAEAMTIRFLDVKSLSGLLINLVIIALLPAIGEELFFRGIIQNFFKEKLNMHLAIWLTAIIFSAIHMQFYGFIPRMLMGALFGYLLWWSGSMWVPILAHFTNNALAVIFYFLYNKGYMEVDLDSLGTSQTWAYALISLIVTVALIFTFFKKKNNQAQPY